MGDATGHVAHVNGCCDLSLVTGFDSRPVPMPRSKSKFLLVLAPLYYLASATFAVVWAGTLTEFTIDVDGVGRSFLEYRPDALPSGPRPLVLSFHGGGGTAQSQATSGPMALWREIADREGLIVIYPDAAPTNNWNDCGQIAYTGTPGTGDDVAFARALVDFARGRFAIDPDRVYATGGSNGGLMSLRLSIEAPDVFAGVSAWIAGLPKDPAGECRRWPLRPSAVQIQMATEDPLIGFFGTQRNESFAATREYYSEALGCDSTPLAEALPDLVVADQSTITRLSFTCPVEASLELLVVEGAGHTLPSRSSVPVAGQNRDVETAEEAWRFLSGKRRAQANLSGVYWDPATPGWGMHIAHQGSTAWAAWYTYDTQGQVVWMVMGAPRSADSYRGTLTRSTGVPFARISGMPSQVSVAGVGNGELRPQADGTLEFVTEIDGERRSQRLERFDVVPEPPRCHLVSNPAARSSNLTDVWWNPSESGWGLTLQEQGPSTFAAWFTYDNRGQPQWITASDLRVGADGVYRGALTRPNGGTPFPLIGTGPATSLPPPVVGELSLAVIDGDNAQLTTTLDGVTQSRAIERFRFVDTTTPTSACFETSASQISYEFATTALELYDAARGGREVGARIFYPLRASGRRHLVFISHGGLGTSPNQPGRELSVFDNIAEPLARAGMVAVVVGHRTSSTSEQNRVDRPADVSFLIDQFAAGRMPTVVGFIGQIDTTRVGHTGHSAGAYTSMALAGGRYPHGSYRDPRVVAIAPISPQGADGFFEAFDNGGDDHTWSEITIPAFMLIGELELDTEATGTFYAENWRTQPFVRMDERADRGQVIIAGQGHADMGSSANDGSPEVRAYIGENIAQFFRVYLLGEPGACEIGRVVPPPDALDAERKLAAGGRLLGCPP